MTEENKKEKQPGNESLDMYISTQTFDMTHYDESWSNKIEDRLETQKVWFEKKYRGHKRLRNRLILGYLICGTCLMCLQVLLGTDRLVRDHTLIFLMFIGVILQSFLYAMSIGLIEYIRQEVLK